MSHGQPRIEALTRPFVIVLSSATTNMTLYHPVRDDSLKTKLHTGLGSSSLQRRSTRTMLLGVLKVSGDIVAIVVSTRGYDHHEGLGSRA